MSPGPKCALTWWRGKRHYYTVYCFPYSVLESRKMHGNNETRRLVSLALCHSLLSRIDIRYPQVPRFSLRASSSSSSLLSSCARLDAGRGRCWCWCRAAIYSPSSLLFPVLLTTIPPLVPRGLRPFGDCLSLLPLLGPLVLPPSPIPFPGADPDPDPDP